MNIEPALFAAHGKRDLSEANNQPLARTLGQNSLHAWSKPLTATLAAHLVAIVALCALADINSVPLPRPESVVVVQLASLAQAAAPKSETPTPMLIEPKSDLTKKTTPQPQPAPLATKAATEPSTRPPTKIPIHKPPPAPPAPAKSAPIPVLAVALEAAPSATSHTAASSSLQSSVNPVASAATTTTIQPKPISQPQPAYPAAARRRGLEGKVVLHVTVGADGAVRAVAVSRSSSHPLLDEAAVVSVWNWRFQPGQMGNEAKEMTISLPVDFRLR